MQGLRKNECQRQTRQNDRKVGIRMIRHILYQKSLQLFPHPRNFILRNVGIRFRYLFPKPKECIFVKCADKKRKLIPTQHLPFLLKIGVK